MDRRTCLRALGVAGCGTVGGCFDADWLDPRETGTPGPTEAPTGTPTRSPQHTETATADPGERFESVVDMVEDRGCDPEGNEPIDESLEEAASDDTLLQFPPGTYLVTEMFLVPDARNFGIAGTGEDRSAVRFVHPEGFSHQFINVRSGRDCLFRNFTVDQTEDAQTNTGIVVFNDDGLLVEDVEVAGFTPSRDQGAVDMSVHVTSPRGEGTVRRFTSTGGGEVGVYPDSYPGVFSGPEHEGTLRLVDLHLEECGSNGLYASRTNGDVEVVGGLFKNSDVAQVRLCGEGSFIREAKVVVDTDDVENPRGEYKGVRGVWWESGRQEKTGGFIEGCNLVCRSANGRRALLQVDGTAGAMTIRNSRLRVAPDDYYALAAFPPGSSDMGGEPKRPWGIDVNNVRIAGPSAGGPSVRLARRPESRFVDVTIEQRGSGQDGIRLRNSPGTRIVRGGIVVDRYPIVVTFGENAGDSDAECALRLEKVKRLRSLTLDSVSGELTELSDSSKVEDRVYCITENSVPVDGDSIVLAGNGDRSVYVSGVEGGG